MNNNKINNWQNYIKNKNLINRIFDMLQYFNFTSDAFAKTSLRDSLKSHINDIVFVETLIKYFDTKRKINKNKIELRCNLQMLVDDLDYLKQYLEKEN